VDLAKLKPCPIKVMLQTDKQFQDVLSSAKSHPERIEPITVAVLGSVQYIVNGHLRARALVEAGKSSTKAHIIPVKEIAEVVGLHIKLNEHGSYDPLGMIDAAKFLKKHNAEHWIEKRWRDLADKTFHSKVRAYIESFIEEAKKRYARAEFPFHVIKWTVSHQEESLQLKVITLLCKSLLQKRESELVFPDKMPLAQITESVNQKKDEKKTVVYQNKDKKKSKVSKEEAERLIRGSPHDSFFECSNCEEMNLLNGRTREVSGIKHDDAHDCIKLEHEDDATPVYSIPPKMIKFLGLERKDKIQITTISSKKDLEKFTLAIKDSAKLRMLVLSVA